MAGGQFPTLPEPADRVALVIYKYDRSCTHCSVRVLIKLFYTTLQEPRPHAVVVSCPAEELSRRKVESAIEVFPGTDVLSKAFIPYSRIAERLLTSILSGICRRVIRDQYLDVAILLRQRGGQCLPDVGLSVPNRETDTESRHGYSRLVHLVEPGQASLEGEVGIPRRWDSRVSGRWRRAGLSEYGGSRPSLFRATNLVIILVSYPRRYAYRRTGG